MLGVRALIHLKAKGPRAPRAAPLALQGFGVVGGVSAASPPGTPAAESGQAGHFFGKGWMCRARAAGDDGRYPVPRKKHDKV